MKKISLKIITLCACCVLLLSIMFLTNKPSVNAYGVYNQDSDIVYDFMNLDYMEIEFSSGLGINVPFPSSYSFNFNNDGEIEFPVSVYLSSQTSLGVSFPASVYFDYTILEVNDGFYGISNQVEFVNGLTYITTYTLHSPYILLPIDYDNSLNRLGGPGGVNYTIAFDVVYENNGSYSTTHKVYTGTNDYNIELIPTEFINEFPNYQYNNDVMLTDYYITFTPTSANISSYYYYSTFNVRNPYEYLVDFFDSNTTINDFDLGSWLLNSADSFLSFELFPNFSLGSLLALLVGIPLLLWLFKMLFGG